MKKRALGSTGLEVSELGFGGFHLLEIPLADCRALLNAYLDAGGSYVETAASYGDGESEIKIGKSIAHRRDEYVLATKSGKRDKDGFLADLNRSLENLCTDHVDLVFMHAVGSMEELRQILSPGGAMQGFEEARAAGKAHHVGISMHGQPDVLIEAIRTWPFEAVMTTINYYDRQNFPEIEDVLVPLARERGIGIVLMKPVADGLLYRSAEAAFRYAIDRPVSVVVAGINSREMLETDLRYFASHRPMTADEVEELFRTAPELGDTVCRQCGKCVPCPQEIDIPMVFRLEGWFDRQMSDGRMTDTAWFALKERLKGWFGNAQRAKETYEAVAVKADQCTACGLCTPKCPYGIDIIEKLRMADYKLSGKKYW